MLIDGKASIDHRTPLEVVVIERSPGGSRATVEMIHIGLPPSHVRVVADLAGALDLLSRGHVDAVVVDLSPPAQPEIAVVEALVAAHPRMAVVSLTSTTNVSFGLETLAAGGEDHLVSSSLDPASLASALLNAVQRKAARPQAFTGREVVRSLLETIDEASCAVQKDGEIVAVNSAWRAFMSANGGREETCAEGSNYLAACEAAPVSRGPRATTQSEVARGLRDVIAGRVSRYQHEYPCHSPTEDRWFTVQMAPTEIEGKRGAIVTQLNVTVTHNLRQSLALQALHDPVTGLPNRLLLVDRLSQALLDCDSRGTGVMVACLDIDNFKGINLGLGRARGDDLLVELAQRISGLVVPKDTVSRVSADQFVIIRGDIQDASEVAGLCEQLLSSLTRPLDVGSTPLVVTAGIGAVVGRLPQTAEDLLDAADAALVDAKRAGIGRVRLMTDDLFDEDFRERLPTSAGTAAAAPHAVHGPTTSVVLYEPIVSLAGGQVVGVEAMVSLRSRDPGSDHGSSSAPMRAGDVHRELAWWALETACRDLATQTGLVRGVDVEVTLPSGSLGLPDVVSRVSDVVERSGLDPRRLVLQISESAMVTDGSQAIGNLDALTAQGIRIALNGFGIGDTRLPQLGRYPIGFLKMDPVFVAGIGVRPDEEAFCSSVISLADALGAGSIAEGVTTAAQHTVLHGYGCHQAQGPLWSRAVPIDDLAAAIFRCRAIAVPVPTRRRRSETQRRPEVAARIAKMQEVGASLPTIAAALNRDGTVNPTGMDWLPSDVARLVAD